MDNGNTSAPIPGAVTHLNFNGSVLVSGTAILGADNRGFRYGDGLFETIRLAGGRMILEEYHFERLLAGAALLGFDLSRFPATRELALQILDLCKKNGHDKFARVRLVVFRGEGGLYDPMHHFPNYIIQSWPLPEDSGALNQKGLVIDVFPTGRKACDPYANLKSNNYLIYAMAARYAGGHRLDDCLVLNSHDRIADSTIFNVFYCRGDRIYTPPLTEGCVAGVMRRFLIETLPKAGFGVQEKETAPEDLENADELFLTNSIRGIRWVSHFRKSVYGHKLIDSICKEALHKVSTAFFPSSPRERA
jgi:branched-chain amino acid aminotransferase